MERLHIDNQTEGQQALFDADEYVDADNSYLGTGHSDSQDHELGGIHIPQEAEPRSDRSKVYKCAAGATAVLGAVELAVEAWKHKQGVPVSSVVALDSEHNLALDTFYYLSVAAAEAKRQAGRLAGRVVATAALVVGGSLSVAHSAHAIIDRGFGGWQELGSGLTGSPMLAAVGNTAITGYILHKTRHNRNPDDVEASEHAKNDRNIAVGKALGSAIHETIDKAAGVVYGLKDLGLGIKQGWASLRGKPEPKHAHGHSHAHACTHGGHGKHADNHAAEHAAYDSSLASVVDRAKREVRMAREVGVSRWAGSRAVHAMSAGAGILRNVFTREERGERRLRRGAVAVGAVGTFVVGTYLVNRFGFTGSEPQPEASPDTSWGGADALDPPTIEQTPAHEIVVPDLPETVHLEAGSNPWDAVGAYAESMGYETPNIQERDAMKDIVARHLVGRDMTRLPVGFEVPMPSIEEIDGIYARY